MGVREGGRVSVQLHADPVARLVFDLLVSCGVTYVFETDEGLARAQALKLTDWIAGATRRELLARDFPADVVDVLSVRFTTHEVIVREAGGDYHVYFQ